MTGRVRLNKPVCPPPPTPACATVGWLVAGRMWLMNISDATFNFGWRPLLHWQPTNYCHTSATAPPPPTTVRGRWGVIESHRVSAPGPDPLGSHYTTAGPSHTSAEATHPLSSHCPPPPTPHFGLRPSITPTHTHLNALTILVRPASPFLSSLIRKFLCMRHNLVLVGC